MSSCSWLLRGSGSRPASFWCWPGSAGTRSCGALLGPTGPRPAATTAGVVWLGSVAGGVAGFVATMALTRWLAVAVTVGVAIALTPRTRARRIEAARRAALTEALASWTEMLRDHVVAGGGPMEAVQVTAPLAPEAIRVDVIRLLTRVERGQVRVALDGFAADVDHPQCDMLVIALHTALAPQATGNFKELLSRIARLLREEVAMRDRVETTRAKARMSGRIVLGMSAAMLGLALVSGAGVIEAFQDPLGQLVLSVAVLCFVAGFWGMARMARWSEPFRFQLRSGYRPLDRTEVAV